MGRYNFISTGAAMSEGLDEFLAREDARKRQAMLDEITKSQEARMVKRDKDVNEDRDIAAQDRRDREDDLLAGRWAQDHEAGEIDPLMAELARRRGFGGGLKDSNIASGEQQLDGETDETVRMRPAITSGGGTKQVMARTAAENKAQQDRLAAQEKADAKAKDEAFKAEQARLKRESDDENKRRDRELKGTLGSVANDLKKRDSDAKADATAAKKDEAKALDQKKVDAEQSYARSVVTQIDKIAPIDATTGKRTLTPGVAGIVGEGRYTPGLPAILGGTGLVPGIVKEYTPGSPGADGGVALDRLQALLDLNVIRELKAQSKTGATGFGALSAPELAILERAAIALSKKQKDATLLAQIEEAVPVFEKIMAKAEPEAAAPAPSTSARPRYDPATGTIAAPGPRKRRYNPATGKLE